MSLVACGTDDPRGTATGSPEIGAPAQTAPTPPSAPASTTPAPPVSVPTASTATSTAPERRTDLGESTPETSRTRASGARILARVVVTPQAATPRTVTVPPGVPVTLSVKSGDGQPHALVLIAGTKLVAVAVPASGRVRRTVGTLKTGRYGLRIDDTEIGHLRVADDVGP